VHNAGFDDHRERPTANFDEKYAPAHPVMVENGGVISQWLTDENWPNKQQFDVNTLHNQGVKTLAPSLRVEAKAPDGLVEAFSLPGQKFFMGVQWHPEWQAKKNLFSQILFKQFIQAASQK
jgi:putative glutamine amidotransferase